MIAKICSYLPAGVLANDELSKLFPVWSAEDIFNKTGIRERRVAAPGECASDLAFHAAQRVLEGVDRKGVDALIFCTQSPDYRLPTSACLIHARLGLPPHCSAVDINQGCSGYIYGLSLAVGLIHSGQASTVLLLNADTYTSSLAPDDRATRAIFGDGAAATLLCSESATRLSAFAFGTDGTGAEFLSLKGGGCREPQADPFIRMNGPEVFNFTLRVVPAVVAEILRKAGLTPEDIDLYVFHQANMFMLEHLRKKLGIPCHKLFTQLERCGNTTSASIPIALEAAISHEHLRPSHKVMLVGFGVGWSWGGCLLEWNP